MLVALQAGVSVTAWVFGHQLYDLVGVFLHPALFFAWMYVLTLTQVPAWSYYVTLLVVGFYTTSLGYLVSVLCAVMLHGWLRGSNKGRGRQARYVYPHSDDTA